MSYHYEVECSLTNLKSIRDFVRASLKDQNVPDLLLNVIVLALDEVCSNVMIHSCHCDPTNHIEIHILRPNKKNIVFEVIDEGTPFDINSFQESNVSNLIQEKKRGGLGILLVKSIMDKIEYNVRDSKNICRLTKEISN